MADEHQYEKFTITECRHVIHNSMPHGNMSALTGKWVIWSFYFV